MSRRRLSTLLLAVALMLALGPLSGRAGRRRAVEDGPPPDPASVAPPVAAGVATDFSSSVAFLYTGAHPIQRGVAPGAIDPARAAVVRGRALRPGGMPMPGAAVRVVGQPELGSTETRSDGMFDLVVNGGGSLTVHFARPGFLPVQRSVEVVPHATAYTTDVVMTHVDPISTIVQLDPASPQPLQVARGSVVADADGARQATVLFPSGTTAEAVRPDGSRAPLASLTVRATEYTAGPSGPRRMPGALPATSGYTYAVELSVDEADALGATGVAFSAPLPFYVENFLGLPVGTPVPVGFYDFASARWIPGDDGVILEITSVAGGMAEIDADGDGAPDDPLALAARYGISDEERVALAGLHPPGATLWRAPVPHFSPVDLNFPIGLPPGAQPWRLDPEAASGKGNPLEAPSCLTGSIVECQNQVLRESIPIAGTPYRLHYRSDRLSGHEASRRLEIPITGSDVPPPLRRVELEVVVAGQRLETRFDPDPDQVYTFSWDGRDAYGRVVQGGQRVVVRIGYVYDATYQEPATLGRSFGGIPGTDLGIISGARVEVVLWRGYTATLGAIDARGLGLGGFSLSAHHSYDPEERVLVRGDGVRRRVGDVSRVIEAFAGNGVLGDAGDGGPALEAELRPAALAAGPDGSVYVATGNLGQSVRRIGPDGTIERFAGGGPTPADEVPATQSSVGSPQGVAVGPDGSVYVSQHRTQGNRVRRIDPSGVIHAFAGSGAVLPSDPLGDGGPAVDAAFGSPTGLAAAPDGSVYIADSLGFRVRRVAPDGTITTVAGTGESPGTEPVADGVLATTSPIFAFDVAVARDGSLYVAGADRVRRVAPDGTITTFAGGGSPADGLGDDGPATQAALQGANHLALGLDGSVYVSHDSLGASQSRETRVRRIDPAGVITTVAGTGRSGFSGSGGPARRADLGAPHGLAVGPDGSVYLGEVTSFPIQSGRIRAIRLPAPEVAAGELAVPSIDGRELYVFDEQGRHLRTLDALTGALVLSLQYDVAGGLTGLLDADGNLTRIERSAGAATAIVAPFGQRTTLTLDAEGLLASVTAPDGGVHTLGYEPGGLLRRFERPRGVASTFAFDDAGRLVLDQDAAGGGITLARTEQAQSFEVVTDVAPGRTERRQVVFQPGGDQVRLNVDAAGLVTTILRRADATRVTMLPDGTQVEQHDGADPRFGLEAPIPELFRLITPGGLQLEIGVQRSATLDPVDGRLLTQTDRIARNGRETVVRFDAATGERRTTSPEGRERVDWLDARGRLIARDPDGAGPLVPLDLRYDASGRLGQVIHGTRTLTFDFDPGDGLLRSMINAEGQTTDLIRDANGRVLQIVRPDLETIELDYDLHGNVVAVTPPGRTPHALSYTDTDLLAARIPPSVGAFDPATRMSYTLDRKLDRVLRPDGGVLDLRYDAARRLGSLDLSPGGTYTYVYAPQSGRLESITTPAGDVLRRVYDGPLVVSEAWTGAVAGSVDAVFDDDLRVASRSVNGAHRVDFGFDADGLVIAAGGLALARHPDHGLVTGTQLGVVSTSHGHDSFGDVAGVTADAAGAPLYSDQITRRDGLGRILERVETVEGVTAVTSYAYDAAGRLESVRADGLLLREYAYDGNGNRLRAAPGAPATSAYDAQDRLLNDASFVYAYNESGELASRTNPSTGATTVYVYDLLGNLEAVVLPDGSRIGYATDGEGRRTARRVDGRLVSGLLYADALNPIAELDDHHNVVSRFIYASREHVPDVMIRAGTTYRILSDAVGSVRLVVDAATGVVAQRLDYDEFGRVLLDTSPGFQPFGFAGGIYDPATGLVRFGTRDYDPETGRFTTPDPIGFAGADTNLYAYAGNDPINHIDPDGRLFSFAAAGAGALVGGAGGLAGGVATQLVLAAKAGSLAAFDSSAVLQFTAVGAAGGALGGIVGGAVAGDPSAASLAAALLSSQVSGATGGLLIGLFLSPPDTGCAP